MKRFFAIFLLSFCAFAQTKFNNIKTVDRAYVAYTVPLTSVQVYGDSTTDEPDEWAELLATDWQLDIDNFAVSGYHLIQMLDRAFTNTVATNTVTWFQCCVNDSMQTNQTRIDTWSNAVPAAMVYLAIADSRKLRADSTNVTTTGTWVSDSLWGGHGLKSTVNGSTIQFTNYGTVVYVATRQTNSGGAGTYTVTIDGVSQGTYQAGGAVYGSSAGASPRLLRFGGLTENNHTVLITVTSATSASNPVWFDWSAGNLGQNTDYGPQVFFMNTIRRQTNSYATLGGSDDTVAYQNAVIRSFGGILSADGLNINLGEFAAIYNPANSNDGTHPNATGSIEEMNAAKAAMIGTVQPRNARIASTSSSGSGSGQTPWLSNINGAGYNLTDAGNITADALISGNGTPASSGFIRIDRNGQIVYRNFSGTDQILSELTGDNWLLMDGMIYAPPGNRIELRPDYSNYVLMARADGVLVTELVVGAAFTKTSAPAVAYTITVPLPVGTDISGAFGKNVAGAATGNAAGGSWDTEVSLPGGTTGTTIRNQTLVHRIRDTGVTVGYPWGSATPISYSDGLLDSSSTAVGNSGTNVTTIVSIAIPALLFTTTDTLIHLRVDGSFASNANGKKFTVALDGVTIWNEAELNFNDGEWWFDVRVYRSGPTTGKGFAQWGSSNALLPHFGTRNTSLTPTWSAGATLTVTCQATTSNDILMNAYSATVHIPAQ